MRLEDGSSSIAGPLARLLERNLPGDPAVLLDVQDDGPQYACPICRDQGYVYDRDPGDFGVVVDGPVRGKVCKCRERAWLENAEDRLLKHWQGSARIPARFWHRRLETHPNLLDPSVNPDLLADLHAWACIPASLWLWGDFGVGKTGIACGYAWEVLSTLGGSVLFTTLPALLNELRATYDREDKRRDDPGVTGDTEQDVLYRYQNAGIVILDDLGAEYIPQHQTAENRRNTWALDRLYQIIGKRHDELRPLVVTSNDNPDEVLRAIGPRITWRLVGACEEDDRGGVIHVQGRNLRKTWE